MATKLYGTLDKVAAYAYLDQVRTDGTAPDAVMREVGTDAQEPYQVWSAPPTLADLG